MIKPYIAHFVNGTYFAIATTGLSLSSVYIYVTSE